MREPEGKEGYDWSRKCGGLCRKTYGMIICLIEIRKQTTLRETVFRIKIAGQFAYSLAMGGGQQGAEGKESAAAPADNKIPA